MFEQVSEKDRRIFTLADGRVLFYAAGRAYEVQDEVHARRLESRVRWAYNLSTLVIIATVLATQWSGTWWPAFAVVPAFFLAVFAEHLVVLGCREATDPSARAEIAARSASADVSARDALSWALLTGGLVAVSVFFRGRTTTAFDALEITLVVLTLTVCAVQVWRHRRVRRDRELVGEPRHADNTPIVPR